MKGNIATLACAAFALSGWMFEETGRVSGAVEATPLVSCFVTGLGDLASGDSFDGAVTEATDGTAGGLWDHLTPERTVTVCGEEDEAEENDDHRGRGHAHGRHCGDDDRASCGCRGRGHHRGRGRGHEDGHPGHEHGRGHCHDDDEPDCHDEIVRDLFQGEPDLVRCIENGAKSASLDGPGTWNGDAGYTFHLFVEDRARSGDPDFYDLTVFAPDGSEHYRVSGEVTSGDIDIHEPNTDPLVSIATLDFDPNGNVVPCFILNRGIDKASRGGNAAFKLDLSLSFTSNGQITTESFTIPVAETRFLRDHDARSVVVDTTLQTRSPVDQGSTIRGTLQLLHPNADTGGDDPIGDPIEFP